MLVAVFLALSGAAAVEVGASTITCGNLPPTIVGTSDDDFLVGTEGDDVIVGLAGDDYIDGLGGNDKICGGSGSDVLLGGAGNDFLLGPTGDRSPDGLDGGDGIDTCFRGGPSGAVDTAVNCE